MDVDLANLNEDRATELVLSLLVQLETARIEAELLERRISGIRRMISGFVEMFPALEDLLPEDIDPDEEPRPRGMDAVVRVLDENPASWYAVPAVVTLLDRRGWLPESSNPANAVRSSLERAVEAKALKKGRSTEGAVIYTSTIEPPVQNPAPAGYDPAEEPF